FRYEVGVDWTSYKDLFEYIDKYPNMGFYEQPLEWGFFYINRTVSWLGGSYALMFFVVALLSWYFIFKSISLSLLPLLLYFLFVDGFFLWSMNGVRQFVSIGIFLFSIRFIVTKNLTLYLLCIGLASLFHISALFLIPLYFVPFQKVYNQKTWLGIFFLSLILSNAPFLVDWLERLFLFLSSYIPLFGDYLLYFESQHTEAIGIQGTGLGYLFRLLVTVFIIVFSREIVKKYPRTEVYFVLFFVGAVLANMFFTIQIVTRFARYFLIFRAVVLAVTMYYFFQHDKYHKIIAFIVIGFYLLLFLNSIYQGDNLSNPFRFNF
ncbi:MAG: EpsG family protein, partial [Pseudomonadota bacterium]|nr:EpsG family protein [Pseudomonadota bacterium]